MDAGYDSPNINRERLSDEIESYLHEHPDYTATDISSANNYFIFYDIRHDYWRNRCLQPGSGCDPLSEPDKLYYYYDLHKQVEYARFSFSRVNWLSTGLDSASFVAGVAALFLVPEYALYANAGAVTLGGVSGIYSFANGDNTGGFLSVGGFFKPPFGTLASGSSVIRDFSAGLYYVPYIPSVVR